MDFAQHTHAQLYKVGVNGIIMWQVSKNLSQWRPAPKNPNAATKTWQARRTTESGEHFIELPPLSDIAKLILPPRCVLSLFAQ